MSATNNANAAASPAPISSSTVAASKALATAVSGFAAPLYRGDLNHGSVAELQEGFRILSGGQRTAIVPTKDLFNIMQAAGLHTSEEEVQDLLRVVHNDERTDGLTFSEFMELLTREISDAYAEDIKKAFKVHDPDNARGTVTRKQFSEMLVTMGEHSSAEELEELLMMTEAGEDMELIDYNKLISELMIRTNRL